MNDNPEEAMDAGLDWLNTPDTVDKPVDKPLNLLVVGSHEWVRIDWVAESILDWWTAADRPTISLIIEQDYVGSSALTLFDDQTVTHTMYGLQPDVRNPERKRRAAMLAAGIDHAFVFRVNSDERINDWVVDLYAAGIDTTILGLDVVSNG